jgi:HK97 family phage portal protein
MANPFKHLIDWLGIEYRDRITPSQAMSLPPFWYGVNKITGHCARLPLFLKRQLPRGGQDKQEQHWAYDLLLTRPNGYQTADTFKQQLTGHAIMWGNGRAVIVNRGTPSAELIPLLPDRTGTVMMGGVKVHVTKPEKEDRLLLFESVMNDSQGTMMFLDSDVIHIQGFGFDGVEGLSMVSQMKRTLGIPTEQESHAYNQTKKGFVAKMIVEAPPGMLTKEADAKEWIDGFNKANSSSDNAGRAALLRNGMKATALSMSNSDSQFLEQRRFSRQDIVLMLGLDGMPGDGDSHSYNSKVMESLNYLDTGLAPWLCKFEMQVDDKLLTASERRRGFFSMFDLSELLRTDPKTQAEIHALRLANRVFNANECREELGRNPYVGGDEYINPAISQADSAAEQRADNNAVESQLKHMVRVESKRVLQHANDKNFLSWMDGWYSDWQSTLADKLEDLGISRDAAEAHCTESKRQLIEATESKPDEFRNTLEKCVNTWENRITSMINYKENEKCLT